MFTFHVDYFLSYHANTHTHTHTDSDEYPIVVFCLYLSLNILRLSTFILLASINE